MKLILPVTLVCLLAAPALAQRRGGAAAGGGRGPAGSPGRIGIGAGGFHQGRIGGVFRSGPRGRFFYGGSYGYVYPSWGLGYTVSPGLYSYPAYEPSSNVTVVYPPPAEPAVVSIYVDRPVPVIHEYDPSGQEINPPASPIYLIAFKDRVIRAASSYRVEGGTLHYVTLDREEKRVALDSIDRAFSLQLNRERRVPFQLPD